MSGSMDFPVPTSGTIQIGFHVFQASLGSPLEFHPAQGTALLSEMIDAYVPGNGSIGEKTSIVSIDFFLHAQATGELLKFYALPAGALMNSPSLTSTPSSSSSVVSPAQPTWNWPSSMSKTATARISKPSPRTLARKYKPLASASAFPASARSTTTDLSQIPGMKILTKDGVDVTNSASRGSKTQEQRDHAHMMRRVGACDACRRKKVRCDPAHRTSLPAANGAAPGAPSHARKPSSRQKSAAAAGAASQTPVQPNSELQQPAWSQFPLPKSTDAVPPLDHSSANPSEVFFDGKYEWFNPMDWDPVFMPSELHANYDLLGENTHFPTLGFSAGSAGLECVPETLSASDVVDISSAAMTTIDFTEGEQPRGIVSPFHLHAPDDTASSVAGVPELHAATNYADFSLYSPSNTSSAADEQAHSSGSDLASCVEYGGINMPLSHTDSSEQALFDTLPNQR
ncbi:hypothetical protein BROUX41_003590 [Berkeleyomyces rouxiae]